MASGKLLMGQMREKHGKSAGILTTSPRKGLRKLADSGELPVLPEMQIIYHALADLVLQTLKTEPLWARRTHEKARCMALTPEASKLLDVDGA